MTPVSSLHLTLAHMGYFVTLTVVSQPGRQPKIKPQIGQLPAAQSAVKQADLFIEVAAWKKDLVIVLRMNCQ